MGRPPTFLVLSASSNQLAQTHAGEEERAIKAALRELQRIGGCRVESWPQIRSEELDGLLRDRRPRVVHFSGHGNTSGELEFAASAAQSVSVGMDALVEIFAAHASSVSCVVLSACHSRDLAELLAEYIDVVVGTSRELSSQDAIEFSAGFYEALALGQSIGEACAAGKRRVGIKDGDAEVLHVHTRAGVKVYDIHIRAARLPSEDIIDFTGERQRHEHFFGRQDLLEELDAQLRAHTKGWVLVTGAPGLGKSALLNRWLGLRLREPAAPTAFHFIRGGHKNWDHHDAIRKNLAAQVEQLFPVILDEDVTPASRLEHRLQRVASLLEDSDQRLVLLVDGLDEALPAGAKANPIEDIFPHVLPGKVFVVVGSRPKLPYLDWFEQRPGPVSRIDLDGRSRSNERAVREYWAALGRDMKPPLSAELEQAAVRAADGNLLHAVKLRQLWASPGVERSVDSIPFGFEGILKQLWARTGKLSTPDKKLVRTGLALLCAAREALPLYVIEKLLEWDEGDGEELFLPHAREMLLEERWHEDVAYRPFHEGMRELLEAKLRQRIRKLNKETLVPFSAWPVDDDDDEGDVFRESYALCHGVRHLIDARQLDAAAHTCADVEYLCTKSRVVGLAELERDVDLAARAQNDSAQRRKLEQLRQGLASSSHWARSSPDALPSLLHNSLLTNAPATLEWLRWPDSFAPNYLRLRHPLQTRSLARVLVGHEGWVNTVDVLGPERLVSGAADGSLRVWDVGTGACLQTLELDLERVSCVRRLVGTRVISGSTEGMLRVWELGSGTVVYELPSRGGRITALTVSADGRVVSGAVDGTIEVWDVEGGKCIAAFAGHSEFVGALAALPDGRVVSSGEDGTVRIWDLDERACVREFVGHEDAVYAVAVLRSGRIVSGSSDRSLRVWNPGSGECIAVLDGQGGALYSIAELPDERLVVAGLTGKVCVWDLGTRSRVQVLEGHQAQVNALAVLPDGRVASASDDLTVRVWDLDHAASATQGVRHRGRINAILLTPDRRAVTASDDQTIRVWDLDTGTWSASLAGHRGGVRALTRLPDGRVVSGSADKTLRVWDLDAGVCAAVLQGHSGVVRTLTTLPDGRVVSGSSDKTLRVWNVDSGEVTILEGHSATVTSLVTLPDGRFVSSSLDKSLRAWRAGGQNFDVWHGHPFGVAALVCMPDGRVLSTSSFDETLRIWDSASGTCIARHDESHLGAVAALPDGRVVSGSASNTLRVWDLGSGELLSRLLGSASFSAAAGNRELLVAGDVTGNVWFVDLPPTAD